jgi:dihydroflavonol-4-reductase
MVVAFLSEAWSRLTGKPTNVTRMGLKTMNSKLRVTSLRAEQELGATFRPFAETAGAVVDWYRANPVARRYS